MPDYILKCKNEECGQIFKTDFVKVEYCSKECQKQVQLRKHQAIKHAENLEKYKDVTDIPTCKICGHKGYNLLPHIYDTHNITQKGYIREYKAKISDIYHSSYTDNVKTNGVGFFTNCKECGKEFEKIAPRKDYCSTECQKTAQRRHRRENEHVPVGTEKKCKQCGKKFEQVKRKPNSVFCRSKCRNRWFYLKRKREAVKEVVDKFCKFCLTKLKPGSTRQFCDDDCKRYHRNTKNLKNMIELHEEKYGHVPDIPTCKICGFKAQNLHHHIKNYHFISIKKYCKKYGVERESLMWEGLIKLHKINGKAHFEKEMAKLMEKHKTPRSG